jgi:phosphatidylglycerophosphate synthase
VPNTLTLGRIIAVPLSRALFTGAALGRSAGGPRLHHGAITDWIDGYLARKLGVRRAG